MTQNATFFRRIVLLCFGIGLFAQGWSQTSISGVINTYTAVTDINLSANAMAVADITGFGENDLVLIMQMQGASVVTTNNNTFGMVNQFNGAGSYELATICNVSGNQFTFENQLSRSNYNPGSRVQIIKVPVYASNTVVSDTLTGQTWDGSTGGVLALKVNGTLTLNGPVIMDGKGFRGAAFENSSSNTCNYLTNRTSYVFTDANLGARKGEGVAAFIPGMEFGRGPFASGGGGGNDYNSGGGGGANAGIGGLGGENQDPNILNCKGHNSGWGGKPNQTANRLLMGGGGGAGHGDNASGSRGGNGGGIIILIADSLKSGTSHQISVRGESAPNSSSDGAGGGGAGGSIHLVVNNGYAGSVNVNLMGGTGGSANNENQNRCFGPGGGGGGGFLKISPSVSNVMSINVQGGNNGQSINTTNFVCNANSSVGAQKGGSGRVIVDQIPSGTSPSITCGVLPVEWLDFTVTAEKGTHLLEWKTAMERNNAYFTVERSLDGIAFQPLSDVAGQGTSQTPVTYDYLDQHPPRGTSFYRIKQTDIDGAYSYSNTVSVTNSLEFGMQVYPNPWSAGQELKLELVLPEKGEVSLRMFDQVGREVFASLQVLESGQNILSVPEQELLPGYYILKLGYQQEFYNEKLVIQR